MSMTKIRKNIQALRLKRGLSQAALAELCGYKDQTRIANYESSGKNKREPNLENIEIIAKALEVSAARLAFDDFASLDDLPAPQISGFPVLNWGQSANWPKNKEIHKNITFVEDYLSISTNCYMLAVQDDSMLNNFSMPFFNPGTLIIVDPEKQAESGKYVIAKEKGALESIFRKYIKTATQEYLTPLNNTYEKTHMTKDISICGVVIAYLNVLP